MNEVEKFDPSKMMDGVKDRIKATFASLIPDTAWDQMVKTVIDDYFHKKQEGDYRRQNTSKFEDLVKVMLEAEAKERISLYLKSEGFTVDYWNMYGQPQVSETTKKLLVENAGAAFVSLMQGTFQSMLQMYDQQLRSTLNRGY